MRSYSLARRQLTRERLRLLVAILGVAFAVVLMLMQVGFRIALFDSAVRFHSHLLGEVFLISPRSVYLAQMQGFSSRRLYQALGHPAVESVAPVYVSGGLWKNPDNAVTRRIFIAGIDPNRATLDLPGVNDQLNALREPDAAIFDAGSRPDFGPVAERLRAGTAVETEIEDRRTRILGLFDLGTSFGIDGNLITSDLNFLRIFPKQRREVIQIGLIQLRPGADPEQVRDDLLQSMPRDVEVLTRPQFMAREVAYWGSATPIGYVFTFGAIMGFIVGLVIVYQILFSDVADHLAEYATLKAIGYRDSYLFAVVLSEAVILAVLGFIPGVIASSQLYALTTRATRLPMHLSLEIGAGVLAMTMLMCGVSGMIAVRKIRSADPAEIF